MRHISGCVMLLALLLLASGACQLDTLLGSGEPKPGSSGEAQRLVFTVQPAGAMSGESIVPAVEVAAQDDAGRADPAFTGPITVSLASNPGDATLSGTTSRSATAGVARFDDLKIGKPGQGYTLTASAAGLASATSTAFSIAARPAVRISLVNGNAQTDTAGATLESPYVVRVTDSAGNGVSGVRVTWAVTAGGGSINDAGDSTDAKGEARATHVLGTVAGPQTVTASVASLSGSPVTFTSTATHGAATEIVFTQQPSNVLLGAIIRPAVTVAVRDRSGNVATSYPFAVSIDIAAGSGTPTASLLGTVIRIPAAGTASFDDLRINLPGLNYGLRVTTGSLEATSATFNVLQ